MNDNFDKNEFLYKTEKLESIIENVKSSYKIRRNMLQETIKMIQFTEGLLRSFKGPNISKMVKENVEKLYVNLLVLEKCKIQVSDLVKRLETIKVALRLREAQETK